MKTKIFYLLFLPICLCVMFATFSCEKKKVFVECNAICDNYDTISEFISAKINGKLQQCNDATLYKINGNELMDNCLFNIMGKTGADSSISIVFMGDTSITNHEILDNAVYFNLGIINFINQNNHNLTKRYSSSLFSEGTGAKNGEIIISSIKDCRMSGSFYFTGIDTRTNDTIQVTDGKFSVRMY